MLIAIDNPLENYISSLEIVRKFTSLGPSDLALDLRLYEFRERQSKTKAPYNGLATSLHFEKWNNNSVRIVAW